jgi:hypothetical protein
MAGEDKERNVAFYIRVSTDRQVLVEEGSLKNQEQMLHAELAWRNEHSPGCNLYARLPTTSKKNMT